MRSVGRLLWYKLGALVVGNKVVRWLSLNIKETQLLSLGMWPFVSLKSSVRPSGTDFGRSLEVIMKEEVLETKRPNKRPLPSLGEDNQIGIGNWAEGTWTRHKDRFWG
jgi:hypothetical protein